MRQASFAGALQSNKQLMPLEPGPFVFSKPVTWGSGSNTSWARRSASTRRFQGQDRRKYRKNPEDQRTSV